MRITHSIKASNNKHNKNKAIINLLPIFPQQSFALNEDLLPPPLLLLRTSYF